MWSISIKSEKMDMHKIVPKMIEITIKYLSKLTVKKQKLTYCSFFPIQCFSFHSKTWLFTLTGTICLHNK